MIYAVIGGVVALLVGPAVGVSPDELWVVVVLGAFGGYLFSCLLFPFRRCPYCWDRRRRHDGDGNYRGRNCLVCGDRPYVRLGARLMGRGSDD